MGHAVDDSELLARYAASRDGAAFGELVRRYVDLVHSAAARRVGDRHLAEDVTQAVFMVLAERPGAARGSGGSAGALSGWLLTTVRYAAANAVKVRGRRRRHEGAAAAMGGEACSANPSDVLIWREAAAGLDDAVMRLGAADRRAVLLRYFERRSIAEVAAALGVSEGAAKQRLSRAVEKLRERLNRGGAGLAPAGAAGLGTLLAVNAVRAAPGGLASATSLVSTGSNTGATAFSIAKGAMAMMTWTKVKAVAAVLAVASVLGTGVVVSVQRASAQQGTGVRTVTGSQGGAGAAVAAVREKAAARVVAAERVVYALDQEREVGNPPLTASFVDLYGGGLRRLAEARIEAEADPAARVKAAEAYVQRCGELCDLLKKRAGQDVTMVQLQQGAYYLADAELLLAKMRAAEEGRG